MHILIEFCDLTFLDQPFDFAILCDESMHLLLITQNPPKKALLEVEKANAMPW
jgi:hypothetical protein